MKKEEGHFDDGTPYITRCGNNSTNDMLTLVCISKKGNIYTVSILNQYTHKP